MLDQNPPDPDQPALNIAIVGATGAVGRELIACLERSHLPVGQLRLLASPRSAGTEIAAFGRAVVVEALSEDSFDDIHIAFFSAGASTSRHYAPIAARAGATVIDNSSAFRMDDAVPLVVPEANPRALVPHGGIIANPNCVAAIAATALAPLQSRWSMSRLRLATYQSASGAGAQAMAELQDATAAALAGEAHTPSVLPHPYAFNFFSHNADMDPETGYNGEELKVIDELRKIHGLPRLPIGITCIRVPVLRCHGLDLSIRFEDYVTAGAVREALATAPGIRLVDDRAANHFPMPIEAEGSDDVLVGRIRRDLGDPSGMTISMFVVGDQLLKGAALNAVQIAEALQPQTARPA